MSHPVKSTNHHPSIQLSHSLPSHQQPQYHQQQSPFTRQLSQEWGNRRREDQHNNNSTTSWPAPPTTSSSTAADNMNVDTPSPSPPTITTAAATSHSESPLLNPTGAETSAASTLSTMASAGPLKKRRKMGADAAMRDEMATMPNKKSECGSPTLERPTLEPSSSVCSKSSIVDHFPSLLHKLLAKDGKEGNSKSEVDDTIISSAMEWLPHGKGWRVLRWDTLCTEVLPKEFPKLCHDIYAKNAKDTKVDGRDDIEKEAGEFSDEQWVEAFVWQIKAWGFEEVNVGKDRGSFRHQVSGLKVYC